MKTKEIAQHIFLSNPFHKGVTSKEEYSLAPGYNLLASGEYREKLKEAAKQDGFDAAKDFAIGIGLIVVPFPLAQFVGLAFSLRAMTHSIRMTSEIAPMYMDNGKITFGGRRNKKTRK